MDKKAFMAVSMLFIVCAGLSLAGPVSAAKVVDHGTKYMWSDQAGWVKVVWKTYQHKYKKTNRYNNNYIECHVAYYIKDYYGTNKYQLSYNETFTFAKVTPSTVKITERANCDIVPGTKVTYKKTKLSAVQYYWRVYRYNIISGYIPT